MSAFRSCSRSWLLLAASAPSRRSSSKYKRPDLLILDEWLLYGLKDTEARDLLDIIEARHKVAPTIFCSQFSVRG